MTRTWDGSAGFDEIINCSAGALSGNDGGPITVAALWKPAQAQFGNIIRANNSGGSAVWVLLMDTDNKYYIEGDFTGFTLIVNVWQLVAYTKASGSATYRGHLWRNDTGAWTHADVSSVGDGTGPVTELRIGGNTGRLDGDMEVLGVWNSVLTDTQIETLPLSLRYWHSLAPDALWTFDQATSSQAVNDLTGGGANQSSITGNAPTVSTSSAPGFTYGHDVIIPHTSGVAAATNANAECATATATAETPSAAIAASAEHAAATAAAYDPGPSVAPQAELAAATATGQDAVTSVAPAVNIAQVTGAAHDPSSSVSVNAECATASAAAHDAAAATAVVAVAECATATTAAQDPAASIATSVEAAGAAGAAHDPTLAVATSVEHAAASATAHDATVVTGSVATAAAECATASAAAHDPSAAAAPLVENAAATGVAQDASTSVATTVEAATAAAFALDATAAVAVSVLAEAAEATALALLPSLAVATTVEAATALAAAFDATVYTGLMRNLQLILGPPRTKWAMSGLRTKWRTGSPGV